jgi:hypothetical protein
VRDGRRETLRAEFGSPKTGGQLLSLERHIQYDDGVELSLVLEIVTQLDLRFGAPVREMGPWSTEFYYVGYKDRQKIKTDAGSQRGGAYSCRRAADYYPPRIFESIQHSECDFIVHVRLEVTELKGMPPERQRYKEARIQYLDVRRARIDLAARNRWIAKLKDDFAHDRANNPTVLRKEF